MSDVYRASLVPVRVPLGVADVEVAVAARVVEVVAEQRRDDVLDARVVDQRAEVLVLVYERHQRRSVLVVVLPAVVSAAVVGPDLLERVRDVADLGGEVARKDEVAEGAEAVDLVLGESHVTPVAAFLDALKMWVCQTVRLYLVLPVHLMAGLEDVHDVAKRLDVGGRVALDHEEVGLLARLEGADFVVDPARAR